MSSGLSDAHDERDINEYLLIAQLWNIAVLLGVAVLVALIEHFAPSFFNYPYFTWSLHLSNVAAYWPLYAYGALFSGIVAWNFIGSTHLDDDIMWLGTVSSFLAGVTEEIGFRGIYICTAMLGVILANWLLSTFIGFVFGIFFLIAFIVMLGEDGSIIVALGCLIASFMSFMLALKADPIFWLYESFFIPVLHYASLGSLDTLLATPDRLFIISAIAANAKFRDGHKYQGLIGMGSNWIVGFVFLHAMMTYGLLTAITVHVVYDLVHTATRFIVRKRNA